MNIPASLISKHFLVVDDYESMRIMVSDQLKVFGIQKITFASSGNEALNKIIELDSSDPIQYVLSDMMMKDGSGIDLVIGIRKQLGKKNLPVLMITSKSEINLLLDAIKAGISNYITKPWEEDEFAKKIIECDKN
jgi:two-component system chemotaxis response regulator CheY